MEVSQLTSGVAPFMRRGKELTVTAAMADQNARFVVAKPVASLT